MTEDEFYRGPSEPRLLFRLENLRHRLEDDEELSRRLLAELHAGPPSGLPSDEIVRCGLVAERIVTKARAIAGRLAAAPPYGPEATLATSLGESP